MAKANISKELKTKIERYIETVDSMNEDDAWDAANELAEDISFEVKAPYRSDYKVTYLDDGYETDLDAASIFDTIFSSFSTAGWIDFLIDIAEDHGTFEIDGIRVEW